MNVPSNIFIAACLTLVCTSANAAVFTATSTNTDAVPDLYIEYDDTNGDGLLSFDEIMLFAGTTWFGFPQPYIVGVPTIDGLTTLSGPDPFEDFWRFSTDADNLANTTLSVVYWSYGEPEPGPDGGGSNGPSVVPLPASLPLLGLGALILGLIGRRRLPG